MKRSCHDDYVWPLLAKEMKKNGSRIFNCDLCDKSFSSGNALEGHKAYHNCSDLVQPPFKKQKLHQRTVSSCSLSSPSPHDDVKQKHTCVVCDKVFPSSKALYGHMRSHSKEDSKAIQRPITRSPDCDYHGQEVLPAIDPSKYLPPRSHKTKKGCSKSIIDYEAINVAQILSDMSRADPKRLNLSTNIDNQKNKEQVTIVKNNNNENKSSVVRFKISKHNLLQTHHEDCSQHDKKEEKNKEGETHKESSHQLGPKGVVKDFDLNEIPIDVAEEQAN